MLIEKNMAPKEGDIVAFRLVNGQEVIGRAVVITATSITLYRPLVLDVQMVSPQQAGLAFMPLMMAVDEETRITISLDRMVTNPVKARQDIAANYVRQTTGIAIPSGSAGLVGG